MRCPSGHVFLLLALILSQTVSSQVRSSIIVDGIKRTYILYKPQGLPEHAPLVFVFHGYTGDAEGTMREFGMNAVADKQGFAVCYPQGLVDSKGNTFWQVGYSFHEDQKVDDVKFILTLATELHTKQHMEKGNTFITGISNGGDLCNLLICRTSGVFKAAAPLLGCIMKVNLESCAKSKPMPVLLLNGMKDDITYWSGDMIDSQGYGPYLSTPDMQAHHITRNQCIRVSSDTLVGDPQKPDDFTYREKFVNSRTGNQVWTYAVKNGRHGIPAYLDMANTVWSFFSLYVQGQRR